VEGVSEGEPVARVPHKTFVRKRGGGWGYQCADCYATMPQVFSWGATFAFAFRHSSVFSKPVAPSCAR
jgi:hypothetical protein